MSFAAKFVEWLLGPLVYLWLATAAFGIFMIAQAVDESFDARLTDLARAIAGHLVITGNPQAPLRLTPAGEALLHADRYDDRHYALRFADGHVFAGDPDMPQVTGTIDDENPQVQGGVLGEDTVRIAAVPIPLPGAGDGRVVLQVAETMARRRDLTASLRAESFLPQLLLLGGSFALVWYGLTYVIAPMRRLKSAIDRRDSLDLTPIDPVQAPEEMQPLIESVNALLARVEDNFEVQRRFIADAAHQLRTPLAGLKSQTELALAQRDPEAMRAALQRLEQATGRTIHLANRLLALARAGTVHAPDHVPVPLLPLVRDIVGDFVPRAVEREIDLGLEAEDGNPPTLERADPLLIREMLSNLVDNALRYTPPGGVVTVAVRRSPEGAPEIDVVDSGPGIPPEERERVFDPFYRGSDAAPGGTGLGLAIVRAIANAHHAEILVGAGARGKGTVIRVTFPAPPVEG
ncbi:MAG: sensor histidine kinase N-terminal domain-containing protein [Burkholderiales bacterium]